MAKAWQLLVQARGDTASAQRALKGLAKSSASMRSSVLSSMGKVAKASAFALGAGLGATVAVGVRELAEMQKASAQTAAVLKSTGGSANVTKKHVEALSQSILNYSGIDDQAVQAGQNMLLTFTNIRNEAGRGNDVFDQSTKILADMSTAMGTDMKTQAIQLGKALNDPVKGVTALSRVGVTFTAKQKETIKSLVDSGKTMQAQKLILKELNKEFGGSARAYGKTLPGMIGRLKEGFADLAATMAQALLPTMRRLISFGNRTIAWITKATARGGALRPIINALRGAWHTLSAAVIASGRAFMSGFNKPGKKTQVSTRQLARSVGNAITAFSELAAKWLPKVAKVLGQVTRVVADHKKAALAVAVAVLTFDKALKVANGTYRVAQGLYKAGKVALMAYRMAKWQLAVVTNSTTVAMLREKVATIASTVASKAAAAAQKAWAAAQWLLNAALTANPIGLIVVAIAGLVAACVIAYKKVGWFRSAIQAVFGFVKKHWRLIAALLFGPIGIAVGLITKHWNKIKSTIQSGVSAVIGFVRSHWRLILAILTGPIGIAVGLITKHFDRIVNTIRGMGPKIRSASTGMWDGVKEAFRSALNWIIDKWNSFKIPAIKVAGRKVSPEVNFPDLPRFARGGIATSPSIFGDGPDAEAAVPLGNSQRSRRDRARVMRQAGLAGGSGGGIVINVNASGGVVNDPHALASRLAWALRTRGLAGRMA